MKHVITLLVLNEPGVLARIVGLISGRGYNIESLNVAPTQDASVSRMTMTVPGSTSAPRTGKGSARSAPPRTVSVATEQLLLTQTLPCQSQVKEAISGPLVPSAPPFQP